MTFKEKYLKMKNAGMLDKEIAEELGVCSSTITNYKKVFKVQYHTRTAKNKFGVTRKDFNIALSHGLSSRLVLQRVREHGWSVADAVNSPKGTIVKRRKRE